MAMNFNSLWPSNTIRRQGTESTLAQVMACCLTAPSLYLNQYWLSAVRSCGIHQSALSWEDLKIPINKTRLKIKFLELHSDLPGANELKYHFQIHYTESVKLLLGKCCKTFVYNEKSALVQVMAWWQHQAITWAHVDPDLCCHMPSLGHNELTHSGWVTLIGIRAIMS